MSVSVPSKTGQTLPGLQGVSIIRNMKSSAQRTRFITSFLRCRARADTRGSGLSGGGWMGGVMLRGLGMSEETKGRGAWFLRRGKASAVQACETT